MGEKRRREKKPISQKEDEEREIGCQVVKLFQKKRIFATKKQLSANGRTSGSGERGQSSRGEKGQNIIKEVNTRSGFKQGKDL